MFWLSLLTPLAHAQATFTNGSPKWLPYGLSGTAARWIDLDGDGLPELEDYGYVYHNSGTDLTPMAYVGNTGFGGWADVDNDGDIDHIAHYDDVRVYLNDGFGNFTADDANMVNLYIVSSRGVSLGDFDGDGWIDAYYTGYEGAGYEPDAIVFNEGGYFTTRTGIESGFNRPGRGVTSCDFDEDGDLDIYVSNYRLERNALWINNGSGSFADRAENHQVDGTYNGWGYSYGHTIGSAWGDLDNDGYIDLFVGNFSHIQPYQDRPKFYRNMGPDNNWRFADLSGFVRMAWQESFASPALADYDNDGDLDLYFTTVYGGDYPVLMRNDGNWVFTDVTDSEGLGGISATYQAAWADVDNDGDLDLATGAQLYINQTSGNSWLKLVLVGDGVAVNYSAIGAQARITTTDHGTQTRQVESGTGEGNANDQTLHFGFGSFADTVEIEVFWPDGSLTTHGPYDLNQTVEITY